MHFSKVRLGAIVPLQKGMQVFCALREGASEGSPVLQRKEMKSMLLQ